MIQGIEYPHRLGRSPPSTLLRGPVSLLHRRGRRPREGMSVCLDTALAPQNQDSSSGWLSLTPVPLFLSIQLPVMFRARPSAHDRPQLSWSTRSDFSLLSLSELQLLRRQEAKTTGPAEVLPSGVPRILLGPDETRSGTHQNKFTHTVSAPSAQWALTTCKCMAN